MTTIKVIHPCLRQVVNRMTRFAIYSVIFRSPVRLTVLTFPKPVHLKYCIAHRIRVNITGNKALTFNVTLITGEVLKQIVYRPFDESVGISLRNCFAICINLEIPRLVGSDVRVESFNDDLVLRFSVFARKPRSRELPVHSRGNCGFKLFCCVNPGRKYTLSACFERARVLSPREEVVRTIFKCPSGHGYTYVFHEKAVSSGIRRVV